MRHLLLLAGAVAAVSPAAAQQRTYINPIDLDYRYNFEDMNQGVSYRTGADPAIVNYYDDYYLFLTLADGYWHSKDLIHWSFVTPSRWPLQSVVAPATAVDGKRLILMPAMTEPGSILSSTDPASGKLDFFVRRMPPLPGSVDKPPTEMKPGEVPPGPWDPGLFKDNDGQWYLYWGSSNVFPIYGQKIAFEDGRMIYQTHAEPMIALHPDVHGWERFGQDHCACLTPGKPGPSYIEGAWMTKVGRTYYLQYAGPGTEFNVYANGVYTSSKPLGPWTYAPYNPLAYKPGGYAEGAGHGSTFADRYGNWWNSGTNWIGYNQTFERRIVIHPAKFYADGQMAVSTRFGDFPHYAPTSKISDPDSLFAGWMLLSYRKPVTASSVRKGFGTAAVTDEDPRSFWVAAANRPGETLAVDLGRIDTVRAVQVNYADYQSNRFADAPDIYTKFMLEASADGQHWQEIARTEPPRRDRPNAYFELPQPVRARFIRYVHGHVGAPNLAVADIRVFGNADGGAPAIPVDVDAARHADQRDATIRWASVPGAIGYNIRFGIRPDRLTLTHQLWADDLGNGATLSKELRSLNAGVRYWVAIEAFNEAGVSKLSRVVPIR
ncbi:MAG TPA: family 43 glycosylhydrolase [Sphingomicrobium sp.]